MSLVRPVPWSHQGTCCPTFAPAFNGPSLPRSLFADELIP